MLRFEVKAGPTGSLFGSVTPTDIADEIWNTKKIRVDRRKIDTDPIKRIGRYEIPIGLFEDVRVEVKTEVVPEGGELPSDEELAELEAAERAEQEAASAEPAVELEEILAEVDAAEAAEAEADGGRAADAEAERAEAEPEPEWRADADAALRRRVALGTFHSSLSTAVDCAGSSRSERFFHPQDAVRRACDAMRFSCKWPKTDLFTRDIPPSRKPAGRAGIATHVARPCSDARRRPAPSRRRTSKPRSRSSAR